MIISCNPIYPYGFVRIHPSGEKILKKREIRTEDKAKRVMIRGNG